MKISMMTALPIAAAIALPGVSLAQGNWMEKMQSWWTDASTVATSVAQDAAEVASGAAKEAYDAAQATYHESWAVLPGEITVCVAKELQGWIEESVVPSFKEKAQRISVKLEAHGSGELADAMNAGNTMKCDLWIAGSDVSALRWKDFDLRKRQSLAYSPTVWVGDKEKLDAARTFLGKEAAAPLSCSDLAKVAELGRYGKIKEGGKGKLDLEMTTSNSGQSMYVSCVYSIVDALDPKEVEEKLNADPALEDQIRAFFKTVKFDVDSTTTLTLKAEGGFMHANGAGYQHLAIATYEGLLPQVSEEFAKQGKQIEVIYPAIGILNNFPAVRVTKEGKNAKAAEALLTYMLGIEAQAKLPDQGFRPANPKVGKSSAPAAKFFNTNIEVGDSPSNRQMLKDLWDIVSADPKAQAVKL